MNLNLSTFPNSSSNGVSEKNNPLFLINLLHNSSHAHDIVAEWLMRWSPTPLLFECGSANPTNIGINLILLILVFVEFNPTQQLLCLF
jgi:hypothetical protein